MLRLLSGIERPDAGEVVHGHGLQLGYYAQEHETLDPARSVYENVRHTAPPAVTDAELRRILGSFLFGGERIDQLAGTLVGRREDRGSRSPTLVVSAANVLLLDEPTNNLDPASRVEVLKALRTYAGAIVLVTHDPGAVDALAPERVVLMPDGVEDTWSDDLGDLVASGLEAPMAAAIFLVAWFQLLLVGPRGSATVGSTYLPTLAAKCIAPDLLGHGEADKPHDPDAYGAVEELAFAQLAGRSRGCRRILDGCTHRSADRGRPPGHVRQGSSLAVSGSNLFEPHDPEPVALAIEGKSEATDPLVRAFASAASAPPNDPSCPGRLPARSPADRVAGGSRGRALPGAHRRRKRRCPCADRSNRSPRLSRARSVVTIPGVDHLGTMKGYGFLEAAFGFLDVELI